MDQNTFDRLSRGLAGAWDRRRLAGLASAGLAWRQLGAQDGEAGKKKKKKKKKKAKAQACPGGCTGNERCVGGQCVDPACGVCPAGQKCIYGICQNPACARNGENDFCRQDQVCCKVAGSRYKGQVPQPICSPKEYVGFTEYRCSMPPGSTYPYWPSRYSCTTSNHDFMPNGDERCCIFNGFPDQGDGSTCCDRENSGQGRSVNGLCCIAAGNPCSSGRDLCCNNQTCPESGVCP